MFFQALHWACDLNLELVVKALVAADHKKIAMHTARKVAESYDAEPKKKRKKEKKKTSLGPFFLVLNLSPKNVCSSYSLFSFLPSSG